MWEDIARRARDRRTPGATSGVAWADPAPVTEETVRDALEAYARQGVDPRGWLAIGGPTRGDSVGFTPFRDLPHPELPFPDEVSPDRPREGMSSTSIHIDETHHRTAPTTDAIRRALAATPPHTTTTDPRNIL